MSGPISPKEASEMGYAPNRLLPSGELAGVLRMIATYGLFVGLDSSGYRTRFCYPTFTSACLALSCWNGVGNPPGPWIKEKGVNKELGKVVDRNNPSHSHTI